MDIARYLTLLQAGLLSKLHRSKFRFISFSQESVIVHMYVYKLWKRITILPLNVIRTIAVNEVFEN